MSLPEVAHRVSEIAKKSCARRVLEGWTRYALPGSHPRLPGLSELFHHQRQADAAWLDHKTERLLSGEFEALGVAWPARSPDELFPSELWRLDPVSGELWPGADAYCFDIRYRHERRLGDIKYVWELNRLQFLQPLALRVSATGDAAALAAIEAAIHSWYVANPPFRGLGWNSGIELALRAISLLVTATLCGERFSPMTIAQIRAMLHAHAFWMDRYPSRFSSANNHLIAEAAGGFLVALAMPDLTFAARLEAKSRRIIADEVGKQFYPDGVPAEQSPTYGAFSAEALWLCVQIAKAADKPLPRAITARLHAFARFIGWLNDGNGQIPSIGDDDEGRVLTLTPRTPSFAVSLCHVIGAATVRSDGLETFPEGGYSVIRERRGGHDLLLVFDHGPLGYLAIAAHGHADALAVVVTIDGAPLFVDPGTYLYHSGGIWRDWFRGTRAHNTLNLDGADQSTVAGPFNWSHKARTVLLETRDGEQWFLTASHDGYLQRFGQWHRRTLFATEDGFSIRDQLEPNTGRLAEIVFQLAADIDARLADGAVFLTRAGKDVAMLRFEAPGEIALVKGGELGQGGGWLSPAFGVKVPAMRISWRGVVPVEGVVSAVAIPQAQAGHQIPD